MYQQTSYRSGRNSQYRSKSYSSRPQNRGPKKAYIHPSKFIQSAKPQSEEVYVPTNKFSDFELDALIKRNLSAMNFDSPSPIQDQAIAPALEGRDIVGIANTGTGKTAAFAIPVLNNLINNPRSKAIILAPTRELAQQIEQQFRLIGKGCGLDGALLIGGTPMGPQLRDLRFRPRIIVGTPGRIKDHLERGSLNISDCNLVVLDEVDRMLDMGFIHDIKHILSQTSSEKQSFYFSATLDAGVRSIMETFSKDPVQISVKSGETGENIDQNIVSVSYNDNKIDKLHDILIQNGTTKALVFDDTHRSVEKLSKELAARGFSADSIHGGKSQAQRQRVLEKFKGNDIKVLVATDVAARGLDVADITHVINYSLPQSYDDYVHRIGRTGRAGKVGYALTFVEQR
ncbi:MAG TPA: DEAD/DEAH box helicase [Candidatus Saccharimonadales bacterium]|jgi:superfamily II DNA/RNA helicase